MSSKIICGMCGSKYWRRYRNTKSGQIIDWSCSEYIRRRRKNKIDTRGKNLLKIITEEGCDNRHIKDNELQEVLKHIANDIYNNKKDLIISHAENILNEILKEKNYLKLYDELIKNKEKFIKQKNILMDKLLENLITDDDFKIKNTELTNKILHIDTELENIADQYDAANNIDLRLNDIKKHLESTDITEKALTDNLISHIDKIVVYEDYLEIYFDFLQNIKIGDKYTKDKKYQYVAQSVLYNHH